ncbi:DUF6390 family protein [Mycolicibacterium sp. 120270]|uniref:DUF6390 family protein n=1 Tax=Mycolicibacterium sp. 120270 TaxID=3090600 RepID=UPI00299D5A97|nr:DUF6390 family protein [Mycolicibacterium sp. 120270]MDX1882176.1 DUF6390 family protein [Mycolicibacterium sp. 120270]
MTTPNINGACGALMFARYAYAPNQLGYCGPRDSRLLSGTRGEIETAARQFTGAWPYLEVLSQLTGIADPLDHRLVDAYWLGGGVGDQVNPQEFTTELLRIIAPQAGHYWHHLTADLADDAAPDHCFHVFAVYPWSRLLGKVGGDEHPLNILDNCRISWGTVVSTDGATAVVASQRLQWSGAALSLSSPEELSVKVSTDARIDIAVEPGDLVALHWGQVCDRLTPEQLARLKDCTTRQLHSTTRQLSASAP